MLYRNLVFPFVKLFFAKNKNFDIKTPCIVYLNMQLLNYRLHFGFQMKKSVEEELNKPEFLQVRDRLRAKMEMKQPVT